MSFSICGSVSEERWWETESKHKKCNRSISAVVSLSTLYSMDSHSPKYQLLALQQRTCLLYLNSRVISKILT